MATKEKANEQKTRAKSDRGYDLLLAFAVVGLIMLLILPLKPMMLDILISISIVLGVTTLLVTLYTEESLSFSSFPALLLILTLFRLGLNIASTRMILTEAQAGEIIRTFGEFVTGGNQIVGFILFALLTGINFVVITKGTSRVAEVAARFNLDSLPGKQMSIDADVNAGVLNEEQAQEKREKIIAESEFYGAMDGASKFVRGDAIAGIIIIFVNIIGSFIIGIGSRGLSWEEVVRVYMTLTVGDGLVTQIPALLISVGAGIIVTRSSAKQHLGKVFRKEMFSNPKVLTITAVVIFLLSLIPGMPKVVMWPIAIGIYLFARSISRQDKELKQGSEEREETQQPIVDGSVKEKDMEKVLFVDLLELSLGNSFLNFIHGPQGEELVSGIDKIRKQIAAQLGIVVPAIRIRTTSEIPPESYMIKIKGNEIASYTLYLNKVLAVNPGQVTGELQGIETVEPAFNMSAIWISKNQIEQAKAYGYAIAEPMTVLLTHITEVIHNYAHELLNRQEVSRLIEHAKMNAPAVIEELVPARLSLGDILKVLQNLLRERISIRDMVTILEILADNSATTRDIDILTEYVRIGLARTISKQYMDKDKSLHAILLDPKVEQMLIECIQKDDFGKHIIMHPGASKRIVDMISDICDDASAQGKQCVLLTSSVLRPQVKRFVERRLSRLPVLAFSEIAKEVQIISLGTVSQEVVM